MGGRAVPEPTPEPPKPVPRTPPPPPAPSRSVAALPSQGRAGPARANGAGPHGAVGARAADARAARAPKPARGVRASDWPPAAPAARASKLEITNFCCPGYLELVRIAIERGWERTPGVDGVTTVRFRILRDGTIDSVSIVQPSGNPTLDAAARARGLARDERRRRCRESFPTAALPCA